MFNLLQNSTTKNCGIILIFLIFFITFLIIIYSLKILYLKIKLKKINNVNHLSFKRRNLKNAETFKFKFDKDLMKEFELFCKRNKITKSSFLENLITENLLKGNEKNVKG